MAVAGGATTAYFVRLIGSEPSIARTTILANLCNPPAEAIAIIHRGETATVQGSDMPEFWRMWREAPASPGKTLPATEIIERLTDGHA